MRHNQISFTKRTAAQLCCAVLHIEWLHMRCNHAVNAVKRYVRPNTCTSCGCGYGCGVGQKSCRLPVYVYAYTFLFVGGFLNSETRRCNFRLAAHFSAAGYATKNQSSSNRKINGKSFW